MENHFQSPISLKFIIRNITTALEGVRIEIKNYVAKKMLQSAECDLSVSEIKTTINIGANDSIWSLFDKIRAKKLFIILI